MVQWGTPVGVGASQSIHIHLAAIAKGNLPQAQFCVANEIVAAEIGRRLRLPIPPCCVVVDANGKPNFCSLNFNLTGNSLPPIIPVNFAATFPDALADILVFDSYICNTDRHVQNLTMDPGPPPRYNLFDHSHALLGGSGVMGTGRLTAMQNSLAIAGNHCLIQQIKEDRSFGRMLERIESLEEYFLTDLVGSMADYGLNAQEVNNLTDFLVNRKSMIRDLIKNTKTAFPGINQWSLL